MGTTELYLQLTPFTTVAYINYKVCAPKIVKNKTYAVNIIHVTQEEEKDKKKKKITKQGLTQKMYEIIGNMNDLNKQFYTEYFLK